MESLPVLSFRWISTISASEVTTLKWSLDPQICRPSCTSIATIRGSKQLERFWKFARTKWHLVTLPPFESYIMIATGWVLKWCSHTLIISTKLFFGSAIFSFRRPKYSSKSANIKRFPLYGKVVFPSSVWRGFQACALLKFFRASDVRAKVIVYSLV